jgi:hypothetical protein
MKLAKSEHVFWCGKGKEGEVVEINKMFATESFLVTEFG